MKKPDSFVDKLWRFRGVLLVACVPILLILAVVLLVPRKSPLLVTDKTHTLTELRHNGGLKYAVVLDAGSTGSRVHVFKFEVSGGDLKLISDTFEQLKPGLSSFADSPQQAADSLKPLLEIAIKTVPKELQAATPISLKATAGLRLLPGDKADKILEAVEAYLKQQPFFVQQGAVSILGGQDEGGFAWLTLNYLLGKLGKGPETTIAAIDLGGGSVQEAFAMTDEEAKAAPKGYVLPLKGAGKTYNVYVHSYLGYGLMAARAKLVDAGKAAGTGNPCFAKGYTGEYAYGGNTHGIAGPTDKGADPGECSTVGVQAMEVAKSCDAPQDQCSFSGGWRGKRNGGTTERAYYVSSYFWDRAVDTGIVRDSKALSWPTTPVEFSQKASEACPLDHPSVLKKYPEVKQDQAPFLCLDLSFCHTLLTKGFGLPDTQKITLVKQIEYNGQHIEAAWPLGAAINDLASAA